MTFDDLDSLQVRISLRILRDLADLEANNNCPYSFCSLYFC